MRMNYEYWEDVAEKVNAGDWYISVRYWEGKPYNSDQIEFLQLHRVRVEAMAVNWLDHPEYARRDGLTLEDYYSWFKIKSRDNLPKLAVIWFDVKRQTKRDRRRYHLHNMLRYRYKIKTRDRLVVVPQWVKIKPKDECYMKELALMGYNIQYSL